MPFHNYKTIYHFNGYTNREHFSMHEICTARWAAPLVSLSHLSVQSMTDREKYVHIITEQEQAKGVNEGWKNERAKKMGKIPSSLAHSLCLFPPCIITHLAFVRVEEREGNNVRESYIILARHSVEFTSAWIFSRFALLLSLESSYFITNLLVRHRSVVILSLPPPYRTLLLCSWIWKQFHQWISLPREVHFTLSLAFLHCLVFDFEFTISSPTSSDVAPSTRDKISQRDKVWRRRGGGRRAIEKLVTNVFSRWK